MKIFFVLLILMRSVIIQAQEASMTRKMLNMIIADDHVFWGLGAKEKIILIDSLGFFTKACSGNYQKRAVEIYDKLPADTMVYLNNHRYKPGLYFVDILTKDQGLVVSFFSKSGNSYTAFLFSITGAQIKILKRRSGDF
jgi:hypothetical protein